MILLPEHLIIFYFGFNLGSAYICFLENDDIKTIILFLGFGFIFCIISFLILISGYVIKLMRRTDEV